MTITIRVPWTDPYNHGDAWNELLAWTAETYGLPSGNNWRFHPTADHMDFHFYNEHDATMFQLKTAGKRQTEEESTVEFVGGLLNGV